MATTGNNELRRLSGIPTLKVNLPAMVHVAPEDEAALAIDEVAIDPQYLDAAVSGTTTVSVSPWAVTIPTDQVIAEEPTAIPALPALDDPYVRQSRTRDGAAGGSAGVISELVGKATFNKVTLPDSHRAKARKDLDARIARGLAEPAFVAVIARKGGTGQSIVTALLGMALAEARADRVLAVDANPERGTLGDRVTRQTRATVDDLVSRSASLGSFSEFESVVSRDETGLDVLASSADPRSPRTFSRADYELVSSLAERYYSVVISDAGTGLSGAVVRAVLDRAAAVVVVAGGGREEAHLGSETITWLESNGYVELAANAVVAVNTGTQGTDLALLEQIETHFEARVRAVARIPYDPALASGFPVHFPLLRPLTREAAREMAALVVDGLPTAADN